MMKQQTTAFVLTKFGTPETAFSKETIEIDYNDDQVVVEVSAFGLNYADVMARLGKYRETPPLPCVIGYEVVGRIAKVGKNCPENWIGKRVLAFTKFGGYARFAVTEKQAFVEISDAISDEDALALCTQYVTAYYMSCYQSQVRAHDVVLVHAAAGGVGSGLVQLCKMNGATVIAKVGTAEKVQRVKALGADFAVNYHETDYTSAIRQFLGDRKLTFSFNPVGGDSFKKDFQLLGAGGKAVLFGGSALSDGKWGILSQLNFLRKMGRPIPAFMMMQSKSILGVNMLKIALEQPQILEECMQNVQQLFQEGKLKTFVDKVYTSDELTEAHHYLQSGKSMGKLVVKWI